MPDQSAQHALNDFLLLELLHSLGSYGVVAHYLAKLEQRVQQAPLSARLVSLLPNDAIEATQLFNRDLRNELHRPAHLRKDRSRLQRDADPLAVEDLKPPRHPAPAKLACFLAQESHWVVDFYASAVSALEAVQPDSQHSDGTPQQELGVRLSVIHDLGRRRVSGATDPVLLKGRLDRNRARLERAVTSLGFEPSADRWEAVLHDDLSSTDGDSLHTAVIGAFVEAHLRMHDVEHLTSHNFGDTVRFRGAIDPIVAAHLERSIVLNTFVYVVARTVPWIFAEDPEEREYVVAGYERCCDTATPTYCMWISHQLSLLALQRRAYTYWLLGRADAAYRDFYKLRRFIRGVEGRLDQRVSRARGSDLFLTGLGALADHHTGRIYRVQHAYRRAVRYFERAERRLGRLERLSQGEQHDGAPEPEPDARDAVRNSRWRVDLLLSEGKARYECGHVLRSLHSFVRAWRAFLDLAVTESRAVVANVAVADGLIDWLGSVADEPDLDKVELSQRFAPLVDQFAMVVGPVHLRLLAAEVMMRLGHLLFVLNLPEAPLTAKGGLRADHALAYCCLQRAAWLDPWSTLSAADILKIERASKEGKAAPLPVLPPEDQPPPRRIGDQWPAGGERYEEGAHIIEYGLQTWLDATHAEQVGTTERSHRVARDLLNEFVAHTDSSNVKLAQVYRYLTKVARPPDAEERAGAPALELVCMRRYSSFFPFLPRPSASRVLGGGYFVRVLEANDPPFGIVIDPGPSFLDNLYRCGYCLDDIHLIVVTHDHADHIAALDALLSLMRYRRILNVSTFTEERKLVILGNDGVHNRYSFLNRLPGRRAIVAKLTDAGVPTAEAYPWPSSLRIEPVETVEHKDAREAIAQGFLLRLGSGEEESTLLFTSDTGIAPGLGGDPRAPPPRDPGEAPQRPLTIALAEAHVVMAHVSSIPLPELRKLAGLERPLGKAAETIVELEQLWRLSREQALDGGEGSKRARQQGDLLRQLQFGFHSLSRARVSEPRDFADLDVTPFSPLDAFKQQPDSHLYLTGLLAIAERMLQTPRARLLLVGELREELGTFRTRIAGAVNEVLFPGRSINALTADIGLKVRVRRGAVDVLCTTCDLDNDLVSSERFHEPQRIHEICVKGEDEGVFYNCPQHDPRQQPHQMWLERVERYDPFGP